MINISTTLVFSRYVVQDFCCHNIKEVARFLTTLFSVFMSLICYEISKFTCKTFNLSFQDNYKMSYANTFIIRVHKCKQSCSNLLLCNRFGQQNIVGTRNGMTHTMWVSYALGKYSKLKQPRKLQIFILKHLMQLSYIATILKFIPPQ